MRVNAANISRDLIAAVDIGTAKVVCTIGRYDPGLGGIKLISLGHQAARGMSKGQIVELDAIESSILEAVHTAEHAAGETLKGVIVNISGAHLLSEWVEVSIPIGNREIVDHDIAVLLSQQTLNIQQPDYEIIHSFPLSYSVDGQDGIDDPRGMFGQTLKTTLHVITSALFPLRNLKTAFKRCHLTIDHIFPSAISSGYATLMPDEMQMGVTVIDMGAGVTDVAIFHGGQCIHTDTIPVGGMHVTNDIARVFSISFAQAERLKTLYGSVLLTASNRNETIKITQINGAIEKRETITKAGLIEVIQPRIEEIFELIRHRFTKKGLKHIAGRRFVLTGGGSLLPGIREMAGRLLNNQVRIGRPLNLHGVENTANGPTFSTSAGLLQMALNKEAQGQPQKKGSLKRFGAWIKESF